MTKLRTIFTCAALLLISIPSFSQDSNFYIFLCFGQSNMEGMINPGVVLQKLVLDLGELKPSYLGPPESIKSTRH